LVVLDASALLALLFDEAGADRVAGALSRASMSAVNLGEAPTRLRRDGHRVGAVLGHIEPLGIEWVSFAAADAARVAELWPATHTSGRRRSKRLLIVALDKI
jgi:PIN domain nuclease of toxin-antitoxin system